MVLATVLPQPGLACPSCYASSGPRVLFMYYVSTIALSLMPFAIVGAIFGLTRFFKHQLEEDAETPLPAEINP